MDTLRGVCSYAIQDDYSYWASKKEASEGGKLLLIDDADYDTHHIFFDDNISSDPSHSIVDVRDLITGEQIPFKRAINKYIVIVDPEKAILENDYFVKRIEECEKRRGEEIENMEKGIASQEEIVQVAKKDEWAILQQLSTNEYLSKAVLPVVYQGLKEIDIERPQDPIKSFAFFLLKNQHLVKLPDRKIEIPEKKEEAKVEEKKGEEKKEAVEAKVEVKPDEKKKDEKKEEKKKEEKKTDAKPPEKKQEAKKEAKKK
jgi:hypothetical protein